MTANFTWKLAVSTLSSGFQEIPNGAVKLVFTVGITDFVSAFFFGITSSASLFQLFAFDQPNQVLLYPTGLIPLFLVPYAVIFHILSITEMQRATAQARGSR